MTKVSLEIEVVWIQNFSWYYRDAGNGIIWHFGWLKKKKYANFITSLIFFFFSFPIIVIISVAGFCFEAVRLGNLILNTKHYRQVMIMKTSPSHIFLTLNTSMFKSWIWKYGKCLIFICFYFYSHPLKFDIMLNYIKIIILKKKDISLFLWWQTE